MKKTRLVSLTLSLCLLLTGLLPAAALAEERPTLELFVNHTWWSLSDWTGSVPEYISDQLGIDLKVTVASDSQQLPLMIGGTTLPDMIYTDNSGNMITILSTPNCATTGKA